MPSVPYHNHDMRYYRRAEVNARLQGDQLLATLLTVDGAGSGLDADKLDGSHASAFAAAVHTHDDRYNTETEIGTLLGGYALLAGRAGGQTLYGGTGSGDDLTLGSTSHATKGGVLIAPGGGKVGIGTASPATPLHVTSSEAGADLTFENTGGAGYLASYGAGIVISANRRVTNGAFYDSGKAHAEIAAIAENANSYVYIRTGASNNTFGSERVRVDKDGKVGIGTTSPQAVLHINGAVMVDGDSSGYAGAVTITDQTQGVSSGTGTVKVNGTTARNSTGWLKILVGTTAVYVPYFQTITG